MLSVLFYIFFLSFTLVYFVVFSVVFILTVPFDRCRKIIHWMSKLWTLCYFEIVPSWKIRIEGLENIDRNQAYVIVANHRSMLDILLLYKIPLVFKWVSKKEVYKWPLFGWVLWMHGDITIERGTAKAVRKMNREGKMWIDRGVSVVIFPEGSRSKTHEIGRFKEGAFMMAKYAGAAVLPVVTEGTGTAFKGWKFNFSNKFRIKVLPPIPLEQVQEMSPKEMAERTHALIAEQYETIRTWY